MATTINKGFIKDWSGNTLLPITRGELVLDANGIIALNSELFLAQDGHPGLITAAERAMLTGGIDGSGSIADVYNKLDYINNGIKVGDTVLNFYNNTTGTPISFAASDILTIGTANNVITFGISTVHNNNINITNTETSTIIPHNITIDKYGRVTNISGTNTLNGISLTNSTASDISDTSAEGSIVNKKYVDNKFSAIGAVTGALIFKGTLSDADTAKNALTEDNESAYYKVSGNFTITADYVYSESDSPSSNIYAKIGDTLIVKSLKFIHIPSGDEIITTLTILQEKTGENVPDDSILSTVAGDITLRFSPVFSVSKSSDKYAYIALPEASDETDGYLKASDYERFNTYASQGSISYVSNIQNTDTGVYDLGAISVGTTNYTIKGIKNTSELSLITDANSNPVLKFKETGKEDVDITIKGASYISATLEDNTIKLEALLGSFTNNTIIDGLTTLSQVRTLINAATITFDVVDSLVDEVTETDPYAYGSPELKAAINISL